NAGLIEATGSGGLTIENSRIDGSSGGSISDGAGSSVTLLGGVIAGGTLTGAGVVQTAGFASGLSGVASTVVNLTTVQVNDGTSLTLSGAIANKSGILLNSAGNTTTLVVGTAGATLSGGGQIKLDDTTTNLVTGQGGLSTLTNVDNTILGAGTLGGAGLVLSNGAAGIINATGANALTIATGSTVTNAGQIFASGAGGLVILDDVANTGVLNVFGSGDLTLGGVVTNGPGGAIHAGDGSTVVLAGAVISGGTLSTTGSGVITCATALGTGANTLDGTTATVVNKAAIVLNGIANLVLQGNIDNAGSIADSLSVLTINGDTVLTGHGSILLGLGGLSGGSAGFSPLINVDNTISGVGSIGGATDSVVLVNQSAGVIDGVGSAGLTIDTGDSAILNSGLIEATTGHVNVDSAVNNRGGVLEADGATLHLFGLVSNTGQVIDKSGTVEMAAANETAGVAFTGTNGTLLLDNSQTYTGQVSGFSHKGGTVLDLTDIAFTSGVTTASFSGNTSGGTLTVTDGTHTAHIALAGDYTTSAFVAASDGNGGTLIHDPAKAPVHVYVPINPSAHAFAQALATFGAASSSGVSLGAAPPIHRQIQLSVGHGAHLS
ncbi:MAG: hypothetical protein ABI306_01320, partial [Caulobacteraceae bacterium]